MKKWIWIPVVVIVVLVMYYLFAISPIIDGSSRDKYCLDKIDKDVTEEMDKLLNPGPCNNPEITCDFNEPARTVINLRGRLLRLDGGEECGIAMAIQNTLNQTKEFTYNFSFNESGIDLRCGPGLIEKMNDILLDKGDAVSISAGETHYFISRIKAYERVPLCGVRVFLNVYSDGETYAVNFMDVEFAP